MVFDEHKKKKYISIDHKHRVSELQESSYPSISRIMTFLTSNSIPPTHPCWEVSIGCSPGLNFRLCTVFPGWHRPQLQRLLATARSLINFADRFAMMKLRCARGLSRVLLGSLVFLTQPLGITASSPLSVL